MTIISIYKTNSNTCVPARSPGGGVPNSDWTEKIIEERLKAIEEARIYPFIN